MNFKHNFPNLLLATLFAIFLSACGGEPKEATTEPAAETTAVPAPATLFSAVVVKHTVADFAKWKAAFDANAQARTDTELTPLSIMRDKDNPNLVFVSMKAANLQKAKDFTTSPGLKEAMQNGGVTGVPEITFYNTIRFNENPAATPDRVIITHRVKDFDAWLKVYDEEGTAARAGDGFVDRALARGVDDPNLVLISFVVTDMAKGKAAIASEAKKQLMMSAGVEGPPQINFYTAQ